MQLADALAARLADIDSKVAAVKAQAQAQLATLQHQRQVLLVAGQLLTPELEASFIALKEIGVL